MLALNSVNKLITSQQQVDDSLLPYLRKHGQHVDSVALTATAEGFSLCQLGPILQLTSLELKRLNLQLQPGNGFEGVLGHVGPPLKRLQLEYCPLLDGEDSSRALSAALPQMRGLQHLSIRQRFWRREYNCIISAGVLQQWHQLTHLNLSGVDVECTAGQARSSGCSSKPCHIWHTCALRGPPLCHLQLINCLATTPLQMKPTRC